MIRTMILNLVMVGFGLGAKLDTQPYSNHVPNLPDLPEDQVFSVLVANVSEHESRLMSNDVVAEPIDFRDLLHVDEDNAKEEEHSGEAAVGNVLEGSHFEGDIVGAYITINNGSDDVIRNAILHKFQKWPKAEVPYVISKSFSRRHRRVIREAIKTLEAQSCIRWRTRRPSDGDFVHILRDDGCYSRVGRNGGPQILSLGRGCMDVGTALHEMLHAVGFWHEQSRPDRDRHVGVQWHNIEAGREDNFARYSRGEVSTLQLDYDLGSIMHYQSTAFSKNGRPTIVSKRGKRQKLGRRNGLSDLDVKKLNKLYDCQMHQQIKSCQGKPLSPTLLKVPNTLRLDFCQALSREDGCSTFKEFMDEYCAKTCELCPAATCSDGDERCSVWVRDIEVCQKNRDFMEAVCPKTCNFCPATDSKRMTKASSRGMASDAWLHILSLIPLALRRINQ